MVTVTHSAVSGEPNPGGGLIGGEDWDAAHVIVGSGLGAPLASSKITRTNTGANETVASTTWEDINSTNYSITLTTGARRCLLLFTGRVSQTGANITRFGFTVDGTPVEAEATGSTGSGITRHDTSSEGAHIIALTDVLTAGSHTFKVRWNASAGTSTLHESASTDFVTFQVIELADSEGDALGSLLAVTGYASGSDTTLASTTSASMGDMSAANAAVTFDAPPSGSVVVRLSCLANAHTGGSQVMYWGLRESTTTVATAYVTNSGNRAERFETTFVITGLTPGSAHTYKAAWSVASGGNADVYTGPTFGKLVLEVYAVGTVVHSDNMPWQVPIPVETTPDATINTWTLINDSSEALNYANGRTRLTCVTSPAQNDEVAWDVVLAAGTWEFTMHHRKSSNVGIYTVTVGAISAGTIDGWSASAAVGRDTLSGIVIPTTGKYRLKLKMATQNVSSSGYVGNPQAISLRRTA